MNIKNLHRIFDSEDFRYALKLSNILNKLDNLQGDKLKTAIDLHLEKIGSLKERNKRKEFLYNRYKFEHTKEFDLFDLFEELHTIYSATGIDQLEPDYTSDLDELKELNKPYVEAITNIIAKIETYNFEGKEHLIKWFSNCRSMASSKLMQIHWGSKVIAPFKKIPPERDYSWDTNDLSYVKVYPYQILLGRSIIVHPGNKELKNEVTKVDMNLKKINDAQGLTAYQQAEKILKDTRKKRVEAIEPELLKFARSYDTANEKAGFPDGAFEWGGKKFKTTFSKRGRGATWVETPDGKSHLYFKGLQLAEIVNAVLKAGNGPVEYPEFLTVNDILESGMIDNSVSTDI